ncbi:hypothetical protein GQ607_012573 [Colletotrichum asianum]|uniref:Uncharacterized protein n=1 Tax=Colletotrichum asianum TaxID=702518 RepID=A0A8H3ZLM5_9PEZI|nr:hypothetical protein GQ607_012573 [Colletotrichum asianum]
MVDISTHLTSPHLTTVLHQHGSHSSRHHGLRGPQPAPDTTLYPRRTHTPDSHCPSENRSTASQTNHTTSKCSKLLDAPLSKPQFSVRSSADPAGGPAGRSPIRDLTAPPQTTHHHLPLLPVPAQAGPKKKKKKKRSDGTSYTRRCRLHCTALSPT